MILPILSTLAQYDTQNVSTSLIAEQDHLFLSSFSVSNEYQSSLYHQLQEKHRIETELKKAVHLLFQKLHQHTIIENYLRACKDYAFYTEEKQQANDRAETIVPENEVESSDSTVDTNTLQYVPETIDILKQQSVVDNQDTFKSGFSLPQPSTESEEEKNSDSVPEWINSMFWRWVSFLVVQLFIPFQEFITKTTEESLMALVFLSFLFQRMH